MHSTIRSGPAFPQNLLNLSMLTLRLPGLKIMRDLPIDSGRINRVSMKRALDRNRILICYESPEHQTSFNGPIRNEAVTAILTNTTAGWKVKESDDGVASCFSAPDASIVQTGDIILAFSRNQLVAVDSRHLVPKWQITMGVEIRQIFVDRRRHRVLAVADSDRVRYDLLETLHAVTSAATGWSAAPILAIDTKWQFYYLIKGESLGEEALLHTTPNGTQTTQLSVSGGKLYSVAFTDSPTVFYAAYRLSGQLSRVYPASKVNTSSFSITVGKQRVALPSEASMEDPRWVLLTFHGGNVIRKQEMAHAPDRLLFAPGAGQLYLVYPDKLTTVAGKSISLPQSSETDSSSPGVDSSGGASESDSSLPIDIDRPGLWAYCAAPETQVLYKIRLSNGKVLARRKLSFSPSALAVDSAAHHIHLVDWINGAVVTVETF